MKNIKNPAKSAPASFDRAKETISDFVVRSFEHYNQPRFAEGFNIKPGFGNKGTELYIKQPADYSVLALDIVGNQVGEELARQLQLRVFAEIIENSPYSDPQSDLVKALEGATKDLKNAAIFIHPRYFGTLMDLLPDACVWSVNRTRRFSAMGFSFVETTRVHRNLAVIIDLDDQPVLKIAGPGDSTPAGQEASELRHSLIYTLENTDSVRTLRLGE